MLCLVMTHNIIFEIQFIENEPWDLLIMFHKSKFKLYNIKLAVPLIYLFFLYESLIFIIISWKDLMLSCAWKSVCLVICLVCSNSGKYIWITRTFLYIIEIHYRLSTVQNWMCSCIILYRDTQKNFATLWSTKKNCLLFILINLVCLNNIEIDIHHWGTINYYLCRMWSPGHL